MLSWRTQQAGDTIVEVMVAIAVVSMVLVAAFVTTNHNVLTTQDTQEHSQALQLAQGQVELLRGSPFNSGDNCFTSSGVSASSAGKPAGSDPCVITGGGAPAGVGVEPAYQVRITHPPLATPGTYQVTVSWSSLLGATNSNVTLFYQQ
jgi:type II secretory pathway pseudopilin PulG